MNNKDEIVKLEDIQKMIFTIRDTQVMIDRDLAKIYQVETKVLNQAVKRNIERFPDMFRFQLSDQEKNQLVTVCDRFETLKHSNVNPSVFTEQGVAMLSAVLRSEVAVQVSIQVIQAFVEMRKFMSTNASIFQRLDTIETKQLENQQKNDQKFDYIFKSLESGNTIPKQGVFFDGQVFDAYQFISNLVRSAQKSIILIDNFIDDSVLTLFSKKNKDANCTIFTKNINKQLKLDVEKFNAQYPPLKIVQFNKAHDRFLIIDEKEVYHIGASLKDLGKKWFAFSKMDSDSVAIINSVMEML